MSWNKGAACAAVALSLCAGAATAADTDYPRRPIRIVVGFTPGGNPDITARLLAPRLTETFKQQVIVDNRPGAGGAIGSDIVAKATPDGHTLLSVSSSHAALPAVYAKLPFDTERDFAGIGLNSRSPYFLVVPPSLGVKTMKDLIAMAKAKPGSLNFASAGVGSGTHFAMELFKDVAAINIVHVPYKGIPEALTETIGGRVQLFMLPITSGGLIREGKLAALAVSTKKRSPLLPDVPSVAEAGLPAYEWDTWGGLLAPRSTPRTIIDRLNREVIRILSARDLQDKMATLGLEAVTSTPAEFDKLIADQIAITKRIAQKAGIKAE